MNEFFFFHSFTPWNTRKFHMSIFLAKVLRVRQKEEYHKGMGGKPRMEGKSLNWEEEMEREERERRLGSSSTSVQRGADC